MNTSGIGLRHGRRVHLQVAVELRVGVGIGDVGGEEHRRRHRLQLDVDAGLLAGLLDDRLGLLARLVDRGLVDELQLLAVLLADAVGALLPARLLEDVVGLVDVELELGVLGAEALRIVDEVRRGDAGAAVDVLLDRILVDQQRRAPGAPPDRDSVGCLVLRLERSPSTSVQGSVVLSWICSILPPGEIDDLALAALLQALRGSRPRPACSRRSRTRRSAAPRAPPRRRRRRPSSRWRRSRAGSSMW